MTNIDREPMGLRVEKDEKGVGLWLDEKRLRLVSEYKIESLQKGNHAELSMKILVQYPVIQGNNP